MESVHESQHTAKNSAIAAILAVAILSYGFGFALRADENAPIAISSAAGPGYTEPLPAKGPAEAPVVLIEVADLRCGYCMKRNTLVKRLMAEHKDAVRIVFKHFPFVSPEYSEKSAIAAMAAHRQHQFWEYVDVLYSHGTELWSETKLIEYAAALGLDTEQFSKDLNDPALESYVLHDRAAAQALDIRATPTLLINGAVVPNWANAADIRQMIRASAREVLDLVESGQATNIITGRAMIAARNHPAGEEFAKRYMYNDVSDLQAFTSSN